MTASATLRVPAGLGLSQPVRFAEIVEGGQANGMPTFRLANETKPLKPRPKKLVE
jgi:hypothetical protein